VKRRAWLKLFIDVDEDSDEIVAFDLTDKMSTTLCMPRPAGSIGGCSGLIVGDTVRPGKTAVVSVKSKSQSMRSIACWNSDVRMRRGRLNSSSTPTNPHYLVFARLNLHR
jgi:hypothetical protein